MASLIYFFEKDLIEVCFPAVMFLRQQVRWVGFQPRLQQLKRSVCLGLADGDGRRGEGGGHAKRRHPRHLAAEGHAPVRLHAFSTGLSSDSASLFASDTHTDIQTAAAQKQRLCCSQSAARATLPKI